MSNMCVSFAPGIELHREDVTEQELREAGVFLKTDFPGASAADFKRYPVLSEGGWYMVIKHQPTLVSVSRKPWRLLGPIVLSSDGMELG